MSTVSIELWAFWHSAFFLLFSLQFMGCLSVVLIQFSLYNSCKCNEPKWYQITWDYSVFTALVDLPIPKYKFQTHSAASVLRFFFHLQLFMETYLVNQIVNHFLQCFFPHDILNAQFEHGYFSNFYMTNKLTIIFLSLCSLSVLINRAINRTINRLLFCWKKIRSFVQSKLIWSILEGLEMNFIQSRSLRSARNELWC